MKRLACVLAFAAVSCSAAAEWVILVDNAEYVAYADPATILRDGEKVQMSDLVDLKFQRPSPRGNLHASSTSYSEFDCRDPRMRPLAFTLHSEQMGSGDIVENVALSNNWLPVAPGTLLDALWRFACS